MDSYTLRLDFSKKKNFNFGLISDPHINQIGHNDDLFQSHMKYLCENDSIIFFNGDIGNFITKNDKKRYVKSKDFTTMDNQLDEEIDYVIEKLKPYADYIYFFGRGNHEVATMKYYNIDPIYHIARELQKYRNKSLNKIICGDYKGFICLTFYYQTEKKIQENIKKYIIFRHHGKGSNSPVTKGMIDLQRITATNLANLYWIGHKHSQIIDDSLHYQTINKNGDIIKIHQIGCITAGYQKSYEERYFDEDDKEINVKNSGYKLNWSEENFYNTNINGCIMLKLHIDSRLGITAKYESLKESIND